jgi:hypothetical protein
MKTGNKPTKISSPYSYQDQSQWYPTPNWLKAYNGTLK